MVSKNRPGGRKGLPTSPWIIIGSVFILLIVVVVLASQNYSREKKYMSQILSEKGAAIIKALEAGARTGMMGMMWGGQQVQALIEETSLLSDVLYITVIDREGLVLASSEPRLVDTRLDVDPGKEGVQPSDKIHWRFKESSDGQNAFEVYRYFRPISPHDERMRRRMGGMMGRMMGRRGSMMEPGDAWWLPDADSGRERIIFVGLDPTPFEEGRREDIRNTLLISGVLVVLGLAGFISMFWMQSYRSTKRSLQDTSATTDQIAKSLPVGLIATDKEGKIAFFNSAAERITGIELEDALGKDAETILPGHFCGLKAYLDRGESIFEKEMECEFREDRVVPVSVSASEIINEAGVFVGQLLIFRDLGEVRRLQDEIRRNEKLAAIGDLAAGVAHEIRNPLSSIKGIASYFKSKFDEGSEDREMAGVMIEETDRVSRVIGELLEFARPAELHRRPSDVNELVEHSARLITQEAAANNVQVQLDLASDPPRADVDPDRLAQCLLNLYLNALQAMENGDRLTISSFAGDDGRVGVAVRDSGSGISADDQSKIFDPYFTTKPKGTGLGLAIVHKIVEAHGGQIKVRSVPGQGTVFSILLPVKPPH